MAQPTQAELAEWGAEWQRLLRLQDWEVRLKVVDRGYFSDPGKRGEIGYDLPLKTADIAIVVSDEWGAINPHYDPKRTVIHELLHLHLLAWETEDGTAEDLAQEQAINAIARAFVIQARQDTADEPVKSTEG